ncbi:AfsR/SARP family transcriptional regulator [Motilibacter deserti]|uniref:AfsR/SARP family transcriptional regulator n=1 Tax=Motilibacter deserti TaxID=2714956 RepID=A0ABX0GXL4_9ACTN|nr:BTAD domain-containing putative transcriptional regulator [Motilibacter deserti]NHC15679.1 AfsR/SARP family transcriptional regulator [Motilibacter deserti]
MGPSTRPRIGVLGPLEALVDGVPVDLGGPRQRAVLGVLAAAHGQVVPAERLVEEVWAGSAPASAPQTLQVFVSKLRRAVEPGRPARAPATVLVSASPGYLLAAEAVSVDADEFAALAGEGARLREAGRAAEARDALTRALALWRGPAYADIADLPALRQEASRLEELRVAAQEELLAARLDLPGAQEAVGELEGLVAAHPWRERPRELLALALYRAGRQADALAALRAARRHLADELGIDPGPALQRLEAAVLAQDPALSPAAPVPATGQGPAAAPVPAPAPAAGPAPVSAPTPEHEPRPSSRRSPIPVASSSFVGRERELAQVGDWLRQHRLVTLVGSGGAGKTRLALEAAQRHPGPDGPWLVLLAGVRDPELVPAAVADALGVSAGAGTTRAEAVVEALRERSALVVLDNCEHVLDAAADLVTAVLDAAPNVRVLATSRERLAVPGEALVGVAPLPVEPAQAGALAPAARLFVDRARAVIGEWEPDAGELDAVRRICLALDGIPLALELAASRCDVLSPAQVLEHLGDRFDLLEDGRRRRGAASPDHHRTLEAAVEWSYAMLGPDEQAVFRMLSVFDGGFDLDAAAAVTGRPVLRPLTALVAKSMVTVDTSASPRRYGMLESLREYAARALPDDERAALRARHVAWLVDLAEHALPRLRTGDSAVWLRRLAAEQANVRAALGHALGSGDAGSAVRIAAALGWAWYRTGPADEGRAWLTRALAAAPDAPGPVRVRGLLAVAMLGYLVGDMAGGSERLGEAIALADPAREPDMYALARVYAGYVQALMGDPDGGAALADEARRTAREAGYPWVEAEAYQTLGQVARLRGDALRAQELLDEGAQVALECGHLWAAASIGWLAAKAGLDRGQPHDTLRRLVPILRGLHEEQDRTSTLALVHTVAGALGACGRGEDGAVLLGAVAARGRGVGYVPERMDPVDGGRDIALVEAALAESGVAEPARAEATARGRALGWDEMLAYALDAAARELASAEAAAC